MPDWFNIGVDTLIVGWSIWLLLRLMTLLHAVLTFLFHNVYSALDTALEVYEKVENFVEKPLKIFLAVLLTLLTIMRFLQF